MNNLFARIFSGILLILAVLFVSVKGGLVLLLATIFISSVAAYEFSNAMKKLGYTYPLYLQIILGVIFAWSIYRSINDLAYFILALNVLIGLFSSAIGKKYRFEDMLAYLFAFMYCNYMFSFFLLLDKPHHLMIVYLCTWGTDTFAYVFGMLFGRNKLTERLSPNKTIEGSLGGTLSSVLLVYIFAKYTGLGNIPMLCLMSLVLSLFSQMGDLCASYIKRITKIKDFGFIILGHGGILDRFDSVVFTLPIAYFAFKVLGV